MAAMKRKRRRAFQTGGRAGGRAAKAPTPKRKEEIAPIRQYDSQGNFKGWIGSSRMTGSQLGKPSSNVTKTGNETYVGVDDGFRELHRHYNNYTGDTVISAGNGTKAYGMPFTPAPGQPDSPTKESIIRVETESRASVRVTGNTKIKVHKATCETGTPTSKSIQTAAKVLGGRVTRNLVDTKLYLEDPGGENFNTFIARSQLDHAHGFNSKHLWFMPGAASPGCIDILRSCYNSDNRLDWSNGLFGNTTALGTETRLLSFMNFKTQMSFTNETAHIPIKLKLHLVQPKQRLDKKNITVTAGGGFLNHYEDIRRNVFSFNAFDNKTLVDRFAIPKKEQHSLPFTEGSTEQTSIGGVVDTDNYRKLSLKVNLAPSADLRSSEYFKTHYNILKTFSKTLDPNDVWRFTHTHHLGSGINWDDFRLGYLSMNFLNPNEAPNSLSLGNDAPLACFYIVESVGVSVTAVVGDAGVGSAVTKTSYQGTSPGNYHCEFKTSVTFAQPASSVAQGATVPFGMPEIVHQRVFKNRKSAVNNAMVRYILNDDIVSTPDEVTRNKAFIPVYTDKLRVGIESKVFKVT